MHSALMPILQHAGNASDIMITLSDFEYNCKKCRKNVHCCIFKDNLGFTFVGLDDAKTIKKKTGKDYGYFLNYSKFPKRLVYMLMHDDPSLEGKLRFSQLRDKRLLRLKTKKDGKCIFLNDKGRCDIYSIRPNICKIYPFWEIRLMDGKLKIVSHDEIPKCGIIKSLTKKQKDVEKTLSKKDVLKIKRVFKDIEKESEFYKKNIRNFTETNGLLTK